MGRTADGPGGDDDDDDALDPELGVDSETTVVGEGEATDKSASGSFEGDCEDAWRLRAQRVHTLAGPFLRCAAEKEEDGKASRQSAQRRSGDPLVGSSAVAAPESMGRKAAITCSLGSGE